MTSPRTPAEEQLADLLRAFPRHFAKIGRGEAEATAALYERELEDIPVPVLALAVQELIRTEDWFPPVSKIREVAAEKMLGLPGETGALSQIEARARWGRLDPDGRGEAPFVHPLVREALDHLGGFHAYRATEEATIFIGQFGRLYRELRARKIRETQVGALALEPGVEQRQLGPGASDRPLGYPDS